MVTSLLQSERGLVTEAVQLGIVFTYVGQFLQSDYTVAWRAPSFANYPDSIWT